jgi:phosphoribosylaminoimidazole-succinocarboxamide synthase
MAQRNHQESSNRHSVNPDSHQKQLLPLLPKPKEKIMAVIPKNVAESDLSQLLTSQLTRTHQGKVRDTYQLSDEHLLVVATDRLSIFDFVLPVTVLHKGQILTSLTVHWLTQVLQDTPNHLVAYGSGIDKYLPTELRDQPELQRRTLVVKKLIMLPVECIIRGHLTGSGWKSYQKDGSVCGIQLSTGLHDGSKLPQPIFTPTTKADEGHDEDLPTKEVVAQYGEQLAQTALFTYQQLANYTADREIILADTKFELGEGFILADEVATPDSSRFWDKSEWQTALTQKKSPTPHDKQLVRNWGKEQGIHLLDPKNPSHLKQVASLKVPDGLLYQTTQTYHNIFARLTSQNLPDFTVDVMHIT